MLDAGVFRCWIPKALGGLEMEPNAALRMFEGIAHADGSRNATRWVLLANADGAVGTRYSSYHRPAYSHWVTPGTATGG